ncbi:unnamed protein product, partial [Closterium sp. NIES-54]
FDTRLDDLHLYLLSDSRDSVSLFDHTSGASLAPPTTADSATCSLWLTRDAAARLAVCNHLLLAERAHFGQHKSAKALYDAVVACYSSPATAALGRLLLPYLFLELSLGVLLLLEVLRRTRLRSGAAGAGGSAAGEARAGGAGATSLEGGAGASSLGDAGVLAGAGGTQGAGAPGPGGARTRGTGAARAGGVGGAGAGGAGVGNPGTGGVGTGGTGAGGAGAGGTGTIDPGARGTGAAGASGVGSAGGGCAGAGGTGVGGTSTGGAGAGGAGAGDPGAGDSLTERRKPESCLASPVRAVHTGRRVPRPRPQPVPGTHAMALRPSSVPLRVPLPPPPKSSLPAVLDPESDLARAASPTVSRLLATVVTGPSFESTTASALVAELVDFAAACRLDYATSLVAESDSDCPPSVGGECALGTDVLEDRREDFECLAATVPHFVATLHAPEGDPDAPDIPTPRSYADLLPDLLPQPEDDHSSSTAACRSSACLRATLS